MTPGGGATGRPCGGEHNCYTSLRDAGDRKCWKNEAGKGTQRCSGIKSLPLLVCYIKHMNDVKKLTDWRSVYKNKCNGEARSGGWVVKVSASQLRGHGFEPYIGS